MTRIAPRWPVLLTVLTLSACGDVRDTAAQDGTSFCPTAADVSETAGFTVSVLPQGTLSYGEAEMCAYHTNDPPGTFVSISVQPAGMGEDPLEEVRSDAVLMSGSPAEPIDIGDGGYAYGSGAKSEAAARKGDRVFRAEIVTTGSGGVNDGKAVVIALLKRVVR